MFLPRCKSLMCLLLSFLVVSQFILPDIVTAQRRGLVTISVLDLDAKGVSKIEASQLSDRLRVELFNAGRFDVMERDKMKEILEEQGFQLSDVSSESRAVEVGRLIGVEKMVVGSVGRLGQVYTFSLRLVDVKTGRIERTATEEYRGGVEGLLTESVPALARKLAGIEVEAPRAEGVVMKKGGRGWLWILGIAVLGGGTAVLATKSAGDGAPESGSAVIVGRFP